MCVLGGIAARFVVRSVSTLVPATVQRTASQEREPGRFRKLPMHRPAQKQYGQADRQKI